MLKALPTITVFAMAAAHPVIFSAHAVSAEALSVRNGVAAVMSCLERSETLFGAKTDAISKLMSINDDTTEVGVSDAAIITSISFVRALPDNLPMPDFLADPDGAV